MGRIVAGIVFALALAAVGAWSPAASAEQACTTPVANPANLGCGDAYRGMAALRSGARPRDSVHLVVQPVSQRESPATDTLDKPA